MLTMTPPMRVADGSSVKRSPPMWSMVMSTPRASVALSNGVGEAFVFGVDGDVGAGVPHDPAFVFAGGRADDGARSERLGELDGDHADRRGANRRSAPTALR